MKMRYLSYCIYEFSELDKKWSTGYIPNWSMVLNQLMVNDRFKKRIDKYINF